MEFRQSLLALDRANKIRCDMSALKHEIFELPHIEGRALVATILERPTEAALPMPVWDLLLSVRKMGSVKANRWLQRACPGMPPGKRVRDLTTRQRLELAQILRGQ